MEKRATERRLSGHVTDEVEGRWIELPILSDRDSLAFPAGRIASSVTCVRARGGSLRGRHAQPPRSARRSTR